MLYFSSFFNSIFKFLSISILKFINGIGRFYARDVKVV